MAMVIARRRASVRREGVRRQAHLLVACLAVSAPLFLSACSTLRAEQTEALLAHPPAELPAQALLPDTPFFPQDERQCGPAALATVMAAAQVPITPQALSSEVFVPDRGGSLQMEMLAAARRHGLVSTLLPSDVTSVLREVSAGHPVVALLNLGLPIAPMWHYAVLIGYDLPAHEVVMRSGKTALLRMPLGTFEHTWARSERWAFVALPPDVLPVTATEASVTQSVVAYERVNTPQRVEMAYRTALLKWPTSMVLAMGLGNARHALGDEVGAAKAFEQVAQRHDSAAAWNNLASVRSKLGDKQGATDAAQHAVRRAQDAEPQWLTTAQTTLAEVSGTAAPGPRSTR